MSTKELKDVVSQVDVDAQAEEQESALTAVPIESVPANVTLPCSLYVRIGSRYVLFRRQGEKVTTKQIISLNDKGTSSLFMHRTLHRLFTDSIKDLGLPEAKTQEARAANLRQLLVTYGQELEKRANQPKKPTFDKLQKMGEQLAAALLIDTKQALTFIRRTDDPSHYFVNHAVNVAIYSGLIAKKLNYNLDRMKQLTYACLVHDVGNTFIPKAILYKRDTLTEDEMNLVRSHTRQGAELLQSVGSPPEAILVTMQHHERIDGKGYPQGLRHEDIHPLSLLCAIGDSYDALTSVRPYSPAYSSREALEIMKKDEGKFDPRFLAIADGEFTAIEKGGAPAKAA